MHEEIREAVSSLDGGEGVVILLDLFWGYSLKRMRRTYEGVED